MPFDLGKLEGSRERWVRTGLEDMEVEIRYAGPEDQERFRQKMIREGIIKTSRDGPDIAVGRAADFFREYAKRFVIGWRNLEVNGTKNPDYNPDQMGQVLAASTTAFRAVREAVEDEAGFFNGSGDDSNG